MTYRRALLIGLILLIAISIAAKLRYQGKASVKLRPEVCDAKLWNHVYEKERLKILEQCTAVDGRVLSFQPSSDGDLHIGLDPEQKSILNLMNVIHGHRELVVEIICEHSPTRQEAKQACADFHSQVMIPRIGDRIRVTGSYVTDTEFGWNEIHPVTRIEVLH